MCYRKRCSEKFGKIQSLLFNKVADLRDSAQVFLCKFCEIFKSTFFNRTHPAYCDCFYRQLFLREGLQSIQTCQEPTLLPVSNKTILRVTFLEILFADVSSYKFNPFLNNVPILYPLKTPENL